MTRSARTLRLMVTLFATAIATLAAADTYYVDKNNGGCNDLGPGTPPVPFCTIQAGYDRAADGDEVRVLPGTYGECLYLFDLVAPRSVSVVADAWLDGGDSTVTIIDGATAGPCSYAGGASASLVTLAGRSQPGSALRGFTVRGGSFSGIFGVGSVAITNNVVRDNASPTYGGGVYVYTANCYYGDTVTTIANNEILGNEASQGGGGVAVAAGLKALVQDPSCTGSGDAAVTIERNRITGNTAQASGGGVNATTFTNSARTANVVITSNTITGNSAGSASVYGYGGGIYTYTYGYGSETVEITSNTVADNTAADLGGGVSVSSLPNHVATSIDHRSRVEHNNVTGNTGKRGGGGIDLFLQVEDLVAQETVRVQASDNTVAGNRVTLDDSLDVPNYAGGGGISAQLYSFTSTSPNLELTVKRNEIRDNSSKIYGGGVSVRSVADGVLYSSAGPARAGIELAGNLIARNRVASAFEDPSAPAVFVFLEAEGDASSSVDLSLNTLVANTVEDTSALQWLEPAPAGGASGRIELGRDPVDGGHARTPASYRAAGLHVESLTAWDPFGRHEGAADLRMNSSIVAGNGGLGTGGPVPGTPGIVTSGGTANVTIDVAYSDVFGNTGGDYESWIGDRTGLDGNIAQDPSFMDPTNDFHLSLGSPAIDAGDPALPPQAPQTDLDGDPRILDGNGDGVAVVDMGSDETVARLLVVGLDVKPDSFPNIVNPGSRGVIPVAILGSAEFDVTSIDVTSLRFGPGEAPPAHDLLDPATHQAHLQDVDLDGYLDLMTHFRTAASGIGCDDTEVTLTGETTLGVSIRATDSIETRGCRSPSRRVLQEQGERLSEFEEGARVEIDRR